MFATGIVNMVHGCSYSVNHDWGTKINQISHTFHNIMIIILLFHRLNRCHDLICQYPNAPRVGLLGWSIGLFKFRQ